MGNDRANDEDDECIVGWPKSRVFCLNLDAGIISVSSSVPSSSTPVISSSVSSSSYVEYMAYDVAGIDVPIRVIISGREYGDQDGRRIEREFDEGFMLMAYA